MTKIAVIGAGITGVTTAAKLHKLGYDVTVFDQQRYAAMETSFANGGQLSASNAEVWNSWSTVLKGLKWMLKSDAPLLMNPKPSWHKISWMLEFLANIPNHDANTVKTAEMAIQARSHMMEMAAEFGVAFDHRPCGIMHFYTNARDMAAARKTNALLSKGGLTREELTAKEVLEKEPTLKGDFVGGFWTESDSTGDIHKFTIGLANALADRGVAFKMGNAVSELTHAVNGVTVTVEASDAEHFDGVVICAGVASRYFAKMLGDRVNIYPVKGYSITVQMDDTASQVAAPNTSLLDDDAKIVTSRLGKDRFRIAGTAEFNGTNRDIRADRIAPLVAWCQKYFPDVSTETVIPWAGLRPMMPNMMPRIGAGNAANVFYNTGHGHLGWTLSGVTADMVAQSIDGHFNGQSVIRPAGGGAGLPKHA